MNRTRLVAAFLAVAVLAVFGAHALPAGGEDAVDTAEISPGEDTWVEQDVAFREETGTVSVTPGGDNLVSIDVQGAEIRTVLRSLSEYSGRNIVADREVQGSISVRVVDVPWLQALQSILRAHKLDYIEENGILRVGIAEQLRAEELARQEAAQKADELLPLVTELARVDFANAEEMKKAVSPTLTKRGHIEVDPRTNSLLITDIEATVGRVAALVKRLDAQTPQVEIVAKLVDVDAAVARELGVQWSVKELHSAQQKASANVAVEAADVADAPGLVRLGVVRDFALIDAQLQALENRKKANIISNPKITTADNREARILVGQEIPLIVLDQAGNPITQLKKIGIELRVTPHINSDERITLDVHPTVSDLSSQATVQGGVIINTTEADTRVLVGNGETAVIGGLIRMNVSTTQRGVPLLQSLPLVGALFRSSNHTDQKRELLIFVTPTIVTSM
jgi:type IV pilus assembly protein PilQ